MTVTPTSIPEVLIIEPSVYRDKRGVFLESFNARTMAQIGLDFQFVQDNHSRSIRHVLRGLHYQIQQPQGKLLRVVFGEVFDVAVDLRRRSPTFGKWAGVRLSARNCRMLWIPPGFAHGFLALSKRADLLYKATDFYCPQSERMIVWNDPVLGIEWPLAAEPLLSPKDSAAVPFRDAEVFD
jgi:dTDP-4-dehydrorhamnose 3,5-epimerase